ncbi:DNA glycosylase/AP lyase ROS1-like isoform X3 [Primulina tabacum]|uniref:DNA glycosylase/AP lyase ROS1-like isoform X3 n=1 Tax=Primulina tabacum TaxID=48773 RepID=UPI003F5A0F00
MAERKEETTPHLTDINVGSWIPSTPAKLHLTGQQLICDNWQENHLVQTNRPMTERSSPDNHVNRPNCSEPGRLLGDYLQEIQCHLVPACSESCGMNFKVGGGFEAWQVDEAAPDSCLHRDNSCSFTTWQASEATIARPRVDDVCGFNFCQPHNAVNSHFYEEDLCKYSGISVKDAGKWTTPFGNLLAPAKIVADNAVSQNYFMATSLSAPYFDPQIEGKYFKMSAGNTSVGDLDNQHEAKVVAESNSMPDTLKDGTSSPSRILFDLNSSPIMIKDTSFINRKSGQFEPITPEKTNKAEYMQKYVVLDSNIDELPVEKDSQENKISNDEVRQLRKKVKNSKLDVDRLCATTSTQLQENHKPDKGGNKEANLTKTPQQRPRRRKHRPKVVREAQPKRTPKPNKERPIIPKRVEKCNQRKRASITHDFPSEGESSGTDSSDEVPNSKNTPGRRREYGRTKGIDKPEPKMKSSTPKIRSLKSIDQTRSSCRRSLNFDLENLVREESSPCCSSANSDMELQEEMELAIKKNHMDAYELTSSSDHLLEEYLSRPNREIPNLSPHTKMDSLDDHNLTNWNICTRGKCQIVFSDATPDKEEITAEVTLKPSDCWTPKSPSDSNCRSTCMKGERQAGGVKRQYTSMAPETELSNSAFYNSLLSHFSMSSQNADNNDSTTTMHFPAIYKKKRTDNSQNRPKPGLHCTMTTSNTYVKLGNQPLDDSWRTLYTSKSCQGSFVSQSRAVYPKKHYPANDKTLSKEQISKCRLALGPTEWIKKKRSKGPARVQKLASLIKVCKELPASSCNAASISRINRKIGNLMEKQSCMEALTADICPTMTKKKRSKRSMLINSTIKNISNQQKFTCNPNGPLFTITWKRTSLIDSVIEKLKQFDLTSAQKEKALVIHNLQHEENYALVPYQSGGAVVPFVSLLDQVKRRHHRPKVALDDETTRVWKLLLDNINSEGIDGTDEENTKWWEEERRVFNGRADSFIARMHLIQGDRRFSPWKGSVVDSVIGVFLTQNVSDHLSSSAFMSLAAHFPFKSKTNLSELYDEKMTIKVEEPKACVLDPGEIFISNTPLLNKPISGGDPEILQDFDYDDIKTVNTVDPPEKIFVDIIPHEDSRGLFSEISTNGSVVSDESITIKSMSLRGVQRESDDALSSQTSVISSQNSIDSPIVPTSQITESYLLSTSEEEPAAEVKLNKFSSATSFVKLLQMAGTMLHGMSEKGSHGKMLDASGEVQSERLTQNLQNENHFTSPAKPIMSYNYTSRVKGDQEPVTISPQNLMDVAGGSSKIDQSKMSDHKKVNSNPYDPDYHPSKLFNGQKVKKGRIGKEKRNPVDWDGLRKQAQVGSKIREKLDDRLDSVDWDAVRCADVNEIAKIIKDRGMNNMLAQRIKGFLNRIVKDHGSTDLEWLRDIPPDKAKEYLLSIQGLGLKSVECVRLLTLHQLAFPVDTNVGRISVRLGWVPLQPLPESLQLHLLELYPVLESIQKYLWPRLCKLDQRTLYELHYQMITFGKVFCTKNKPNCNACPMRGECRHFASAFASARLGLPAPEEKNIVSAAKNEGADQKSTGGMNTLQLPSLQVNQNDAELKVSNTQPIIEEPTTPEPIIEVPVTPEPEHVQVPEFDIENPFHEDLGEIPTIQLNMEEFNHNLQKIMQQNAELQEKYMSKALVALNLQDASIPFPKLKNVSQLRTEHQVYELPDSHPLLEGMDKREQDDPSPYLLAIWTPGETLDSIEPPKRRCSFRDSKKLCTEETCSSCNSIREADSQTVRGTLLVPCRTAMRGSFPLNGTYFQVNEVFSDHESSLNPMDVPREWLWNMPRRTVYFGTSIPTIFKVGLSTEGIQHCFWRGFVCVRGFDRRTRAPRPLIARLHFPASKLVRRKGKIDEN